MYIAEGNKGRADRRVNGSEDRSVKIVQSAERRIRKCQQTSDPGSMACRGINQHTMQITDRRRGQRSRKRLKARAEAVRG